MNNKLQHCFLHSRDMSELVGEIFLPRDMPEPPKQSLIKSLLGGGMKSVDREELCK